jgi:spore coat protein CotH
MGMNMASGAEPKITGHSASGEFFSQPAISTLTIQLKAEDLRSLATNPRVYVRALVVEGKTEYSEVGIHLKGSKLGSFRSLEDKPALTLNFDKYVDDQTFHGMDKVYLNNSVEDATYMTEYLCGQIFQDAGIPTPRVSYVRVILQGRDRGLYVLKEGFDKTFLAQWFRDPNGNFYEPAARHDLDGEMEQKSGSKPRDASAVTNLAAAAGEPDSTRRWERLSGLLDVDKFASFLAAEVVTWHWDGYGMNKNNYRLYHDPGTRRLVFLPHGMDVMFDRPEGDVFPRWEGTVAKGFVDTPEGRKRYLNRMKALVEALSKPNLIEDRIAQLDKRLQGGFRGEEKKKQAEAVKDLRQRIKERLQFLQKHIEGG